MARVLDENHNTELSSFDWINSVLITSMLKGRAWPKARAGKLLIGSNHQLKTSEHVYES